MAKTKHLRHPVSSLISCTLLLLSALLALQLPGPITLTPINPPPSPISPGTSLAPRHTTPPQQVQPAITPGRLVTTPAATPEPTPTPAATTAPTLTVPEANPKPGPDRIQYPYTAFGTADALSSQQWDMNKISASSAWAKTTGQGVVVAVIDTGFDFNHEDLAGQWWTNPGETGPTTVEGPAPNCTSRGLALDRSCNNYDDDGDGYVDDWRGWDFANNDNDPSVGTTSPTSSAAFHASFVSGLIAAIAGNGKGISGVAPSVKIMPIQVLDDTGSGYTDAVAAGVKYAADHGANVISMSLGSSYDDPYLHEQVDYAINNGIPVIAASGNNGCDCVAYPANYPEVIAVGATDSSDHLASFSNYGPNLDIVAPGVNVCSVYWTSSNPTSGYTCTGSGTSFATPEVSGAVALLISLNPGITPDQIASALTHAAKVAGMNGQNFTQSYGYGRLDVSYFDVVLQALLDST